MSHSADQKRSSFARLALFFGFGDSSAAPAPLVTSPTALRSPRSFTAANGAVGLGIVAAMSSADPGKQPVVSLTRTKPLAICAGAAKAEKRRVPPLEEMELSEGYTCVTSYLGGNPVEKGTYCGDGDDGIAVEFWHDEVLFFVLPQPFSPAELVAPPFQVADFLRRCFRCKEELDGLDIYMYRGEKSFCSEECRCQQMVLDDLQVKLGTGTKEIHERSVPPPLAPSLFAAEVVMA